MLLIRTFHRVLLGILSRKGLQYDSVLLLTLCCVEELLSLVLGPDAVVTDSPPPFLPWSLQGCE